MLRSASMGNMEWVKDLEYLGFKGKLLQRLVDAIGDESNVGTFYKFLSENDGKFRSKLSLVSRFEIHMKEKQSYQSYSDFSQCYIESTSIDAKKSVLEKLFTESLDSTTLNKVLSALNNNRLTLEKFYELVVLYRKSYNAKEIMTLIEYKYVDV
jgi:hypothetical protein